MTYSDNKDLIIKYFETRLCDTNRYSFQLGLLRIYRQTLPVNLCFLFKDVKIEWMSFELVKRKLSVDLCSKTFDSEIVLCPNIGRLKHICVNY